MKTQTNKPTFYLPILCLQLFHFEQNRIHSSKWVGFPLERTKKTSNKTHHHHLSRRKNNFPTTPKNLTFLSQCIWEDLTDWLTKVSAGLDVTAENVVYGLRSKFFIAVDGVRKVITGMFQRTRKTNTLAYPFLTRLDGQTFFW